MKHVTVFCLVVLCAASSVCAQNRAIDSLNQLLTHENGPDRFAILYELVFQHLDIHDYARALVHIDETKRVAFQYDDSLHIVKACRVRGQILQLLERNSDAINEFKAVLPISHRNKFDTEEADILNSLAVIYTYQAHYDKALRCHFECLALREKSGNSIAISGSLNNIGLVYYKLNNYEKALKYYNLALNKENEIRSLLLTNIGLCHVMLEDYAIGQKFIINGMRHCVNNCDGAFLNGEGGLALSFFKMKKYNEAEDHFKKSNKLAIQQQNKRFELESLVYMAKIKIATGQYGVAQKLLEAAKPIGEATEHNELLSSVYRVFSELSMIRRDYKKAAKYQSKYIILRDTVDDYVRKKNLMMIQVELEERDNKAKIAGQKQILALNQSAIRRQKVLNLLMVVIALLLVALAAVLITLNRNKQKVNRLLEQKVRQRTQSLEESLSALQRNHSELGAFITRTSQDIIGPVVSMKGLSAVMYADSSNPESTRENVKHLEHIVDELSGLLTKLTTLNKENASKRLA